MNVKLFGVYEGAAYYFDAAIEHAENDRYETAIEFLTKGYKHIDKTPAVRESKARAHTETAVNALQEERCDSAREQLNNLKRIVEQKQGSSLQSCPDSQR